MAVTLTLAQELTLKILAESFHVPPVDPDTIMHAFDLPPGWVTAVVGGVTFGISPDGSANS